MNHTITLTPKLNVPTPAPAPRLSLCRVLWYKVLKWIEGATSSALIKALVKLCVVCMLGILVFAPSFALGYLTAALQWNNYRIPIFCAVIVLTFNAKRLWRLARKGARVRTKGNQHTFHGVAVPDLVTFLQETQAFKRDEAIKRLALSQGQYAKIGQELEKHGILTRGEANARVMRPIGREHLAMQLRDNFPLVWDETREIWVERDGAFARWTLDREFKQRRLEEVTARKERKLERIEKRIEEAAEEDQDSILPSSPLAAVFAHARQ